MALFGSGLLLPISQSVRAVLLLASCLLAGFPVPCAPPG